MRSRTIGRSLSFITISVFLFSAAAAIAGYRSGNNVSILKNADGSGWGQGSAAVARSSSDGNQEIACQVSVSYTGTASCVCYAWDANNNYISCTSQNPGLVAQAQAFGTDSYLNFIVGKGGYCVALVISNSSALAPKTP